MQLSEEEKQRLRDGGMSEEDIAAYEADTSKQAAPAPVTPEQADNMPMSERPEDIPSYQQPSEPSGTETTLGVLPAVATAVGAGGALVGGYKLAKNFTGNFGKETRAINAQKATAQELAEFRKAGMMDEYRQKYNMPAQTQQAGPRAPVQPGGPGQPPVQGGFQRGQFNMPQQPNMQTGMPSDVRLQQGQMTQPDKMTIFRNPNAGNYIERMSELSKTYGPAQQAVQPQPQAQPQPKPSGFPRGTFRGGGGGGGGGGGMGMYDPTNRRKPLQF
jgi:hypothetical protein